jgi:sensor histidine kinase YesM
MPAPKPLLFRYEPIFHVLFWAIVLVYPFIKFMGQEGGYSLTLAHEFNHLVFSAVPTYLLYFFVFPRTWRWWFFPAILGLYFVLAWGYQLTDQVFHEACSTCTNELSLKSLLARTVGYAGFSLIAYALHLGKIAYQRQMELESSRREQTLAELRALQARVNPHFLFNTLNAIYLSALKREQETPEMILQLADNYRYLFREGQREEVRLKQEIQHIKDFVNLQEKRMSEKAKVSFIEPVGNLNIMIAPLLLLPFVENAFKYTSILRGNGHPVHFSFTLTDNIFTFSCTNPVGEKVPDMEEKWTESGVGIKLTRRRLAHLYPDKHSLTAAEQSGLFIVNLRIIL